MNNQEILFAADNHYGTHGSRVIYDCLRPDYPIRFEEDAWPGLAEPDLKSKYSLLILSLISGSCNVPPPGPETEEPVRQYVESGGNLLLLHGGSAAFWPWAWWRPLVGYRWVRAHDADGFKPSTHPKHPYSIRVAKCRHPLCTKLQDFDMPHDEIYTELEQTCPVTTLMETVIDSGTFPMCYEAATPFGGRILGYLPGHFAEAIRTPQNLANVRTLLDDLLGQ